MKWIPSVVFAVLSVMANTVCAETYHDMFITLEIPNNFVGPEFDNGIPYATRVFYKKAHADKKKSAMLQITTYDFGPKMPEITEDESGSAADKYLNQFLKEETKHRSRFMAARPKRVELAGYPASRVAWSANLDGHPVIGVTFCVIVKGKIVNLQAQDMKETSAADLNAAIDAINAVRFNR